MRESVLRKNLIHITIILYQLYRNVSINISHTTLECTLDIALYENIFEDVHKMIGKKVLDSSAHLVGHVY